MNFALTNCCASFDDTSLVVAGLTLFLAATVLADVTTVVVCTGVTVVTIRCCPAIDTILFWETTANCAT